MKNKKILFAFVLLIAFLSIGCLNINLNFNSKPTLKIIGDTIVEKGKTIQLTLDEYDESLVTEIEWVSANDSIASVDSNGLVTGVNVGTTTIVARDTEDEEISGRLIIKVIKEKIAYSDEAPDKINTIGKQNLYVNETAYFEFETTPYNASQDVEWSSSDENVLTVSNTGIVTAHQPGDVIVTCFSSVDKEVKSSLHVQVTERLGYDNYEDRIIQTIAETKNSILGVGNYSLAKDNSFALTSIGSGFVYKTYPVIDGEVVKTFDEEVLKTADLFYSYLFTNRHVVEDADKLSIYLHMIDEEVPAELIGYDSKDDIAVVGFEYSEYIKPLSIASTESLVAGQTVIAIGNPADFQFSSSATQGIISAPTRHYADDTDGDGVNDWDALYIQHDAAINPGNSGGPLLNIYGDVIGINTMKFASSDIDNMGFSIPSLTFINLLPYLENDSEIKRISLGIKIVSIQDLKSYGTSGEYEYKIPNDVTKGIYITEVSEGSLAQTSGLVRDDIIIKLNGENVSRSYHIRVLLNEAILLGEETLEVTVLRSGKEKVITIKI